jgi:hypothetical protein
LKDWQEINLKSFLRLVENSWNAVAHLASLENRVGSFTGSISNILSTEPLELSAQGRRAAPQFELEGMIGRLGTTTIWGNGELQALT